MWKNENEFEEWFCKKLPRSYHMEVVSCVGFPDRLLLKNMKLIEFKHMDSMIKYTSKGVNFKKKINVCADWFTENQLPRLNDIVKFQNINLIGYKNDDVYLYKIKDSNDIAWLLQHKPEDIEEYKMDVEKLLEDILL
jgi:hypothetical protein